jgi:hypothetical protein
MTAGGYRPNSGPMPGTKYRPRANKKEKIPKVPKKRGRPPKVKVEDVAPRVDTVIVVAEKAVEKIAKPVKVKKTIKPVAIVPAEIIVEKPIAPQPTSLEPTDIANAAAAVNLTPLDYLLSVMNNPTEDKNIRVRVAGMIAPFIHPKPGERTGKKDEKEEKAQTAFTGKFKAGRSPLSLVK